MKEDKQSYWYNYVTGEYELRETPTTDEEAEQFIPQDAGVNLYRLLQEHKGFTVTEAMLNVLTAATKGHKKEGD